MTPLLQLLSMAPVGLVITAMLMGVIRFRPEVDHQRRELERVQAELSSAVRQANDDLQRAFAEVNAGRDALTELAQLTPQPGVRMLDLLEPQPWEHMDVIGKKVKLRTYGEPGRGKSYAVGASSRKEGDYGFVPATAVDGNEVVEEIHELGKKDPVAVVLKDGTVVDQAELASRSAERTQRAITGKPRSFRDLPEDVIQTNLGYSDPGERPRVRLHGDRRPVPADTSPARSLYQPGRTMADAKKVAAAAAVKSDRDYCLEQLLARGIERVTAEWTVDGAGLDLAVMAETFRNPPKPERAPAP